MCMKERLWFPNPLSLSGLPRHLEDTGALPRMLSGSFSFSKGHWSHQRYQLGCLLGPGWGVGWGGWLVLELGGLELRTHMFYPGLLLRVHHNPLCAKHAQGMTILKTDFSSSPLYCPRVTAEPFSQTFAKILLLSCLLQPPPQILPEIALGQNEECGVTRGRLSPP